MAIKIYGTTTKPVSIDAFECSDLFPEPLLLLFNQTNLKSDSVLRYGGVVFGASVLVRTEFD